MDSVRNGSIPPNASGLSQSEHLGGASKSAATDFGKLRDSAKSALDQQFKGQQGKQLLTRQLANRQAQNHAPAQQRQAPQRGAERGRERDETKQRKQEQAKSGNEAARDPRGPQYDYARHSGSRHEGQGQGQGEGESEQESGQQHGGQQDEEGQQSAPEDSEAGQQASVSKAGASGGARVDQAPAAATPDAVATPLEVRSRDFSNRLLSNPAVGLKPDPDSGLRHVQKRKVRDDQTENECATLRFKKRFYPETKILGPEAVAIDAAARRNKINYSRPAERHFSTTVLHRPLKVVRAA